MKTLNLALILSILISLSSSSAQIKSSDLDHLKADLNHLLGQRYYILKNNKTGNEVTVIIFKKYSVTRDGKISYYEYPGDIVKFLSKNINKSYNFKIDFQLSPYIPPSWIDESIRKENIKLMLLLTLGGVASIFIGFIIFRSFAIRAEKIKQKKI